MGTLDIFNNLHLPPSDNALGSHVFHLHRTSTFETRSLYTEFHIIGIVVDVLMSTWFLYNYFHAHYPCFAVIIIIDIPLWFSACSTLYLEDIHSTSQREAIFRPEFDYVHSWHICPMRTSTTKNWHGFDISSTLQFKNAHLYSPTLTHNPFSNSPSPLQQCSTGPPSSPPSLSRWRSPSPQATNTCPTLTTRHAYFATGPDGYRRYDHLHSQGHGTRGHGLGWSELQPDHGCWQ